QGLHPRPADGPAYERTGSRPDLSHARPSRMGSLYGWQIPPVPHRFQGGVRGSGEPAAGVGRFGPDDDGDRTRNAGSLDADQGTVMMKLFDGLILTAAFIF